jgi:thioredoxin 1
MIHTLSSYASWRLGSATWKATVQIAMRHHITLTTASSSSASAIIIPFTGSLPDFQATVQSSSPILVEFFTLWCKPCQTVAPDIDALAALHSGVKFLKLNVEECEDVSALHDIRSVPTFLGFKDGHLLGRVEGAQLDAVEKLLVQLEDPTPLPPDYPDPLE